MTDLESGAPIKGVRVDAAHGEGAEYRVFHPRRRGVVHAFSDVDGRYRFEGLGPGSYALIARPGKTDHVPRPGSQDVRWVRVESGAEVEDVDFELEPGGRLRLIVRDEQGRAVPLARCMLAVQDQASERLVAIHLGSALVSPLPPGLWQGESDGRGIYESSALPLGETLLAIVYREGYTLWTRPGIQLDQTVPHLELEAVLGRGASLSGAVVQRPGGQPAADCPIFLRASERPYLANLGTPRSDSRGAFEITGLSEGRYLIRAGWEPAGPESEDWRSVALAKDEFKDGLVLEVDQKKQEVLAGRVVDDQGLPVAGARVSVYGGNERLGGRSDQDGRFRFQVLGGERTYTINASARDLAVAQVGNVRAGREGIEIVLSPEGTLAGTVVGLPHPFPGAVIWAARRNDGWQSRRHPLGEDGQFALSTQPGDIHVIVLVEGLPPSVSDPVPVSPGEEVPGLRIPLQPTAFLEGRVLGEEGEPVRDAEIRFEYMHRFHGGWAPGPARSDARGRFVFKHLPAGGQRIYAMHPNYVAAEPVEIELEAGDRRELEIQMTGGARIEGLCLRAGRPAPGVGAVILLPRRGGKFAATDPQGRFELTGLPAGRHMLLLDSNPKLGEYEKRPRRYLPVELAPGGTAEVEADLEAGASLRGTVRPLPDDVLKPMAVLLRAGDEERRLRLAGVDRIDASGAFKISTVELGAYLLEIVEASPYMPDWRGGDPQRVLHRQPVNLTSPTAFVQIELAR